jgi:hypothetical protein
MGNYHEALMRQEQLRDCLEDEDEKKHRPLFGNPFRIEKVHHFLSLSRFWF